MSYKFVVFFIRKVVELEGFSFCFVVVHVVVFLQIKVRLHLAAPSLTKFMETKVRLFGSTVRHDSSCHMCVGAKQASPL